jgi:DNA-binding transcriptional MerR regulator
MLVLRVVKRLLDAGLSLQNIRSAVDHLRARGVQDLATVTLISDGVTIYDCQGSDEIIDLLRGGQCVFGLGAAMRDILTVLDTVPSLTESPSKSATIIGLPTRHSASARVAG